ncbi:MAG: hypothetical protein H6656_21585, partial [Ardenticatenaceae bacterium]|nr:hypothetical protein [Ardenticatenaceae bacterium]
SSENNLTAENAENAEKNLVNLRNLLIFIHGVALALMKSPSKIKSGTQSFTEKAQSFTENSEKNLCNLRILRILIDGSQRQLVSSLS